MELTERFDAAYQLASDLHRHQLRKSSRIPYLSHLLAVASLVLEHHGTENEAIAAERQGKPVDHVNPPQTFKIENPVAVVSTSPHPEAANAFRNFQYTAVAQKLWAQAGFRPIDPAVTAVYRDQYPVPVKLWTIDDLGGWSTADPQLFDKSTGSITKVYMQATG